MGDASATVTHARYDGVMPSTHLWQEAAAVAARAHRHQERKDGRTPYFSHPARVALTIAVVFECADEKILAAALLHDVIEDTTVDYDELLGEFDREIADIVAALSKDKRMIEPCREREYREALAGSPWQVKLIKLADVYDNLADAQDREARRKLIGKARDALEIAGDDPHLETAARRLHELIRQAQPAAAT